MSSVEYLNIRHKVYGLLEDNPLITLDQLQAEIPEAERKTLIQYSRRYQQERIAKRKTRYYQEQAKTRKQQKESRRLNKLKQQTTNHD